MILMICQHIANWYHLQTSKNLIYPRTYKYHLRILERAEVQGLNLEARRIRL